MKGHVPDVLQSGILYFENGSYVIVPWDGRGVPDVISKCNFIANNCKEDDFPFGVWRKKSFECRKAGMPKYESSRCTNMWPYIVMKRCKGKIYAEL